MQVLVCGMICASLMFPPQMWSVTVQPPLGLVQGNLGIPTVTAEQTLFIGDSITHDWTDEPVRAGFAARHACEIRLHLGDALAANPQVKRVVIEAGTNDIIGGPGGGIPCDLPGLDAVTMVLNMVRTAQAAGLEVFVLSVLPISWNNRAGHPCGPLVPPFNAALQTAITAQGAYWVDDYDAFIGHPDLQTDGVHPNEAGYQVMEQVYAAAAAAAEGH